MKAAKAKRIRDTVYVVGAGFSKGLGYPLTNEVLTGVWDRLPAGARKKLTKIIEFHHPTFDPAKPSSFPDIEQLLTEIEVNIRFFTSSRPAEGRFTETSLRESRKILLSTIESWFHELYEDATRPAWLSVIVNRMRRENAAIVSFNWDLVLDHKLFEDGLDKTKYGLSKTLGDGPILLKPHGSLNWYKGKQLQPVADAKKIEIFHSKDEAKCVHAFLHPRNISSKTGKRYNPLIIPPTFFKNFRPTIFTRLWQNCTDILSTPNRIVFLGYSLPPSDLHAHFILRCGFHNQLNGRIKDAGTRHIATGAAEVIIVNPSREADEHIRAVAGPHARCTWIKKRIEDWV